jgi:hypothetical protein
VHEANSCLTATWSPTPTDTWTVPLAGAVRLCSIFMASTARSGSPFCTAEPSVTCTATTEPGIGLRTVLSADPESACSRAGDSSESVYTPPFTWAHVTGAAKAIRAWLVRPPTVSSNPAGVASAETSCG